MSVQYAIYASLNGSLIADYSGRVQSLTFSSNNRGWAECSGFIPMGLYEAFSLYDHAGLLSIAITDTAAGVVYTGRLEDVAITGDGVTLTALGYSRSLSDVPYSALWSAAQSRDWGTLTTNDLAGTAPQKYAIDFNNRIYIGLLKGTAYLNGLDYGIVGFRRPSGSSRGIVGLSFDVTMLLPLGWDLIISRRDDAWGAGATIATIAGTGGTVPSSLLYTFTASASVTFLVYNNSGGLYNYALENGVASVQITNIRVVTATTNMVNTTTTATFAAGANVTITVVSTARMYAGQHLSINFGATSEAWTVVSVTNSTQVVIAVVGTTVGATGYPVQAFVIYADEIADDLITTTAALNTGQLNSSTALTDSPAIDLFDESYEDRLPSDVLDYLVSLGDTQARTWEWGVGAAQRLYFRVRSVQRTWYIDVSDLTIDRTLDGLNNSVYAVYHDANDRTIRSAASADTASVARYGLTRRAALGVSSTSAAQAAYQLAAFLADGKDPRPRSGVTVRQVFDAGGSRWPLYAVAAGDLIVIRNLSPNLSLTIDRVRVFRLSRASYAFDSDTLTMESEAPLARLDAILAQLAAGISRQVRA